jgi:hypothetical protein
LVLLLHDHHVTGRVDDGNELIACVTAVALSAGVDAVRANAGSGAVGTGCGELLAVPPPPHAASNTAQADKAEIRRNMIEYCERKLSIPPINRL